MPEKYIVVWKDAPGQMISTVQDPDGNLAVRSSVYVAENQLTIVYGAAIHDLLDAETGEKYAIPLQTAREQLGWDVT